MKKILALFLITALCFAILSSCGNTEITPTTGSTIGTQASTTATVPLAEIFGATLPAVKVPTSSGLAEYSSYVCEQGNGSDAPQMDKNFWNSNAGENPPFSTTKITFDGIQYDLTYTKSSRTIGNLYRKHTYRTSKGDVSFYMDEATQECVGFWFSPELLEADDKLPDIENFEEKVFDIADKYVSPFIDIKDYKRTHTDTTLTGWRELSNTKIYKVVYTKYYNGIRTNDTVDIEITSKGKIKSLHINNVGIFDDITKEIDIEKVNKSVEEKVYAASPKEVFAFEIEDQFLGHTSNGDLVIISTVRITIPHPLHENQTYRTSTIIATAV